MKVFQNHLFIILFVVSITTLNAQNQKACQGEKYSQFDFWQGSWSVYDTANNLIGENTLVKLQDNCVMQENWISKTSNSKGTSYNYYNKNDDSWNQVWIDNSGNPLVLKGGLVNNKMVLVSELITNSNGSYYNRITWTPNADGSVTQVWEYLNKEKKLISEAFRGIYKKK